MRAIIVFRKTLLEMSRDGWLLGLTLAFAPFFVLLYYLITAGGSTTYTILTINNDTGTQLADGMMFNAGREAVAALKEITYADGQSLLKTRAVADLAEAESILRERGAVAFILIPENFSQTLAALQGGDRSVTTKIIFGGDVSNPYYMVGVNLGLMTIDAFVMQTTGQQPLIGYKEEPLGASAARTEYETYVPGTLIFAVIMLIFLASMTVAREIETGGLRRLQLTPMNSLEYLGGVTAALVLVGTASFALAFICAAAVGFRSAGQAWVGILVGAVTCLSVIGVGMIVHRRQLPDGDDDVLLGHHLPSAEGRGLLPWWTRNRLVRYPPSHPRGCRPQQSLQPGHGLESGHVRVFRVGLPFRCLLFDRCLDVQAVPLTVRHRNTLVIEFDKEIGSM
jgi:hypothetical protein